MAIQTCVHGEPSGSHALSQKHRAVHRFRDARVGSDLHRVPGRTSSGNQLNSCFRCQPGRLLPR